MPFLVKFDEDKKFWNTEKCFCLDVPSIMMTRSDERGETNYGLGLLICFGLGFFLE